MGSMDGYVFTTYGQIRAIKGKYNQMWVNIVK